MKKMMAYLVGTIYDVLFQERRRRRRGLTLIRYYCLATGDNDGDD